MSEQYTGKPKEFLIYSSPATLSYNSPGAQGYGVKRAGLVIPESIMLVVSPACCGRNTTILADEGGYADRLFYLQMDETDLVTGRHLDIIPEAIQEILEICGPRPKVCVICITCVDALLGTDLERVCRKAEAEVGIHVVPSYMYALTREGTNPPMVAIRETIYSLLEKKPTDAKAINLLGNFSYLEDDCELFELFAQVGITKLNEVGRIKTLAEYMEMGAAAFNLIINPESRKAAFALEERLGIPYAELARLYEIDRIERQYKLFGAALGVEFDDAKFKSEAALAVAKMQEAVGDKSLAVCQVVDGNPVEMALAFAKYGLNVVEVFANTSDEDEPFIKELMELVPDIEIHNPLEPKMFNFSGSKNADITIGVDGSYYYPQSVNVTWNGEAQPFGYVGLKHLADKIMREVTTRRAE